MNLLNAMLFALLIGLVPLSNVHAAAPTREILVPYQPTYLKGEAGPLLGAAVNLYSGESVYAVLTPMVASVSPQGTVTIEVVAVVSDSFKMRGHSSFNFREGTFKVTIPFLGISERGVTNLKFPLRVGDTFEYFDDNGTRTDSCYDVRRATSEERLQGAKGTVYAYTCRQETGALRGQITTFFMSEGWKWMTGLTETEF